MENTNTIQSTAKSRDTSSVGTFIEATTVKSRTRAALGTLADENEAAVEVKLKIIQRISARKLKKPLPSPQLSRPRR